MIKKVFFRIFFLSLGIVAVLAGPGYGELKALTNDELSEVSAKAGLVNRGFFDDLNQASGMNEESGDYLDCTDPGTESCAIGMDDFCFQEEANVSNQAPPQPYNNPMRFPSCTSGGCGR